MQIIVCSGMPVIDRCSTIAIFSGVMPSAFRVSFEARGAAASAEETSYSSIIAFSLHEFGMG
jgi:hypothetical protein